MMAMTAHSCHVTSCRNSLTPSCVSRARRAELGRVLTSGLYGYCCRRVTVNRNRLCESMNEGLMKSGYQDAEDFLGHEREGEDGEDEEETEGEERRDFLDINRTPKTPPKTPLTPKADTSLTSRTSAFSFASFTAVTVHFSLSRRRFYALVTLLVLALMLLAAVALLKIESLRHRLFDFAEVVWRLLVLLSEAVEVAIEGIGFALGRATARFGTGFERGYRL
jgi:hypothetical protein